MRDLGHLEREQPYLGDLLTIVFRVFHQQSKPKFVPIQPFTVQIKRAMDIHKKVSQKPPLGFILGFVCIVPWDSSP